jgi:hypothetical protein
MVWFYEVWCGIVLFCPVLLGCARHAVSSYGIAWRWSPVRLGQVRFGSANCGKLLRGVVWNCGAGVWSCWVKWCLVLKGAVRFGVTWYGEVLMRWVGLGGQVLCLVWHGIAWYFTEWSVRFCLALRAGVGHCPVMQGILGCGMELFSEVLFGVVVLAGQGRYEVLYGLALRGTVSCCEVLSCEARLSRACQGVMRSGIVRCGTVGSSFVRYG